MRRTRGFVVVRYLLLMLMALTPLAGFAQDTPAAEGTPDPNAVLISIRPKDQEDGSRFEAEVGAGETVDLTAVMTNFGASPIELRVYTADVVPAINGGLRLAERGTEPTGTSLWMSFSEEEFTLQPQESIERPITITVPEGTPAGQYVNAVALETVNPINPSASSSFEQFFRKVVSVYITVPGDLAANFELGTPEVLVAQGRSGIQIPLSNTGNVRIDLVGAVLIKSPEGNVVYEGTVQLGPVYNGQQTMIQIAFGSVPPPGDYLLTYSLTDNASEVNVSTSEMKIVVPEDSFVGEVPVAFENVSVAPNADPIVFANVSVDVVLINTSYRSTRLTMSVYRDGELVEDFVLAENLSLAEGTTTVSQRYLPETNWESGTYTFSLRLDSTENDTTTLLLEEKDVATLEVP